MIVEKIKDWLDGHEECVADWLYYLATKTQFAEFVACHHVDTRRVLGYMKERELKENAHG